MRLVTMSNGSDPVIQPDDRRKHLELIQAVISRMAAASFQTRGWTVTITTALMGVVVAAKLPSWVGFVGVVPAVLFWYLDAFYLLQERLYRALYEDVIRPGSRVSAFSLNVDQYRGKDKAVWRSIVSSRTVLPLHLCVLLIVLGFSVLSYLFS